MQQNLIVETKTYHLSTRSNSCQLLNGEFKSNVQYDIPDMIYKDDTIEYIQYSIPHAIIPVSFYTINENNNTLHVLLNGVELYYNFNIGNYNANYFMTQFISKLGTDWFISLDSISSKFTISHKIYDFTFFGDSTIDYIMGFSETITSNLKTMTMPRPCNFLSIPRVCIRCSQLANSGNMLGNTNTSDILVAVPNNSKPNGQIVFENNYSKSFVNVDKLDSLNIQLTDDDGNLLNFNGISSFFVIQFDIYRKDLAKPEKFKEIQKNVESHMFRGIYNNLN